VRAGCMLPVVAALGVAQAAAAPGVSTNAVIARVNDEEIREAQLNAGLPRTWLGIGGVNQRVKAAKYERLIAHAVMAQYLAREGLAVDAKAVDVEIERLRETPPTAGCSCCRYASVEQYMRDQGYTMGELRRQIANDLGIEQSVRAEWEKLPVRNRTRDEFDRQRIQGQFIKVSHIFFNTFQKPGFDKGPEAVERLAYCHAGDALSSERLRLPPRESRDCGTRMINNARCNR